jgi:hypothetical protein
VSSRELEILRDLFEGMPLPPVVAAALARGAVLPHERDAIGDAIDALPRPESKRKAARK